MASAASAPAFLARAIRSARRSTGSTWLMTPPSAWEVVVNPI
jgi:hypothetical protein